MKTKFKIVIALSLAMMSIVIAAWDDTKSTSDTLTAAEWNAQVTDKKARTSSTTLVVAASNSKTTSKADYICDGTADQIEINNAINALSSAGGKVVLLEGNYSIDGTIIFANSNSTLSGMGVRTKITLANSSNCNMLQIGDGKEKTGIKIENIFFDGNVTGQTYVTAHGDINIILLKSNTNYVTIEGCRFENSTNACITDKRISGYSAEGIQILNNNFYNDFYHIDLGMSGTPGTLNNISIIGNLIISPQPEHDRSAGDGMAIGHFNGTLITDNKIYDCEHNGMWVGAFSGYTLNRAIIANNYLDGIYDDGIQMVRAENCIITGNTIRNPNMRNPSTTTNQGIKLGESEYSSKSNKNVVIGNVVIDDRVVSNSSRGISSEYNSENNTIAFNYVSGFEGGNIWDDGVNTKIFGNEGWTTENNVLSPTFAIDSTGVKTISIPHGLDVKPELKDCQLTVVEDTNVDDWGYDLLKVESTDTTNVVAKVKVSTASATGGATAKLALRVGFD